VKAESRREKRERKMITEEYPLQILKGCPKGGVVYMKIIPMKPYFLRQP